MLSLARCEEFNVNNPRIGYSGPEYPPLPVWELLMEDLKTSVQNTPPLAELELLILDIVISVQNKPLPKIGTAHGRSTCTKKAWDLNP